MNVGAQLFILAAVLAFGLGRVFLRVALRLRLLDRPGHRKIHKRPVAYLGGLAVFGAVLVAFLALPWLPGGAAPGFSLPSLLACVLPALAAVGLGLWDDAAQLSARFKFLGQAVLALAFSQFAYRFSVVHVPGFAPVALDPELAVLITAFFIVAVVNGFNMIDGSDGLCLGASGATLLGVAAVASMQAQPQLELLALAAGGACAGFLYWNWSPARMYLGDAGSLGLGFLVACLLVALGAGEAGQFQGPAPGRPWQPYHYQFVVALVLAGLPALEVVLTVARRGLLGRSLGRGDQGHLHHRLANLGLGPRAIMASATLLNLACAGIALAFLASDKGLALLLSLSVSALLGLALMRLGYFRLLRREWLDDRRPHYAVAGHFTAMQSAKLSLTRSPQEVMDLVAQACRELGVQECRIKLRETRRDGGKWDWNWVETGDANPAGSRLDHVSIPGIPYHAAWTLPADGREPEIEMNLRVVLSEFMRKAVQRLGDLSPRAADAPPLAEARERRRADPVSIKVLKERIAPGRAA